MGNKGTKEHENLSCEVLIVGAGGSGLAASIAAAEKRRKNDRCGKNGMAREVIRHSPVDFSQQRVRSQEAEE